MSISIPKLIVFSTTKGQEVRNDQPSSILKKS